MDVVCLLLIFLDKIIIVIWDYYSQGIFSIYTAYILYETILSVYLIKMFITIIFIIIFSQNYSDLSSDTTDYSSISS